jgi:hypothetical protein
MVNSELKPCPFCGGSAEFEFGGTKYIGGPWKGFVTVRCSICKSNSRGSYYNGPEIVEPFHETKSGEIAASIWNRRISDE